MALIALLLASCASESSVEPAEDSLVAAAPPPTVAALTPLGQVPYDGLVLPLISPGADLAATHFGAPPSWAQLLGAPGAMPPEWTAVRIYSLSERGARATATVSEAVVLGRGADQEGFLVEAPRPDGSRWIGRVAWNSRGTTDPVWLVSDGHVNAFATLGPGGTMAWSRRHPAENFYSLVLRRGDREAVIARAADESWLLPSFSSDGSRLFALVLRHRELLLRCLPTSSITWRDPPGAAGAASLSSRDDVPSAAMSDPHPLGLQRHDIAASGGAATGSAVDGVTEHPLARDATVELAWQALASTQGWPVEAARPSDALLVFDPGQRRLALWRSDQRALSLLPTGSLAGAFADPQTLVLGLAKRAVIQSLIVAADGRIGAPPRPLAEGSHLPRGTLAADAPIVLLSAERGSISVVGVRLGVRERIVP